MRFRQSTRGAVSGASGDCWRYDYAASARSLALAFVPMSIGALTGVTAADAGVASGLINTSQQIGGAIGVAVATTIATTLTANYVDVHPGSVMYATPVLSAE